MEFPPQTSPRKVAPTDVAAIMRQVIWALVPGMLCMIWFFGWSILFNIVVSIIAAVAAEAFVLRLRDREIKPVLSDGSAIVTGLLLGLSLPPLVPWWIPVIGIFFAIVIAKQLYGGLGYNPFNPAMVGFVVLIVSFPLQMTIWSPPWGIGHELLSFTDALRLFFLESLPAEQSLDAISMATPLDDAKTQISQNFMWSEVSSNPLYGNYGGYGWEWINLAFLAGGLWMWQQGTIAWRIPVTMLSTLFGISLLFHIADTDAFVSPVFHLFSGATMLCAFFIATDPVSAATTPRGRIYFGIGIGILIFVIRTWGGYPEGVAFAVLLMNMAVPAIDYYTQPRVFGHKEKDADS